MIAVMGRFFCSLNFRSFFHWNHWLRGLKLGSPRESAHKLGQRLAGISVNFGELYWKCKRHGSPTRDVISRILRMAFDWRSRNWQIVGRPLELSSSMRREYK